jgi:hypothetical protein
MTLGEFLTKQASKIGKQNDPALVALLSNSELANRDISDDLASSLDSGLLSLESAKNNASLKTHFFSQALNGVDSELIADLDLDEDVLTSIKNEKNTYGKIKQLKEAVKTLKVKKGEEGNAGKKEEYEAQIKQLNSQIVALKGDKDREFGELTAKHSQELINLSVESLLKGKSYANKDLTAAENASIAKTLVDSTLQSAGAKIVRDNGVLKLKQAGSPDLDFYQDNRPTTFEDFTNKVLADKKLLAVSGGNTPPNTPPVAPVTIPAGGGQQNTQRVDAAIAASIADLKTE